MDTIINVKDFRQGLTIYMQVLQKFHKLTKKEIEVTVELVIKFKQLTAKYDAEVAGKLFLNKEVRNTLQKKFGIADQQFRNILSSLRKKGVLKNTGLTPIFLGDKLAININIIYEKS